MKNKLMLVSALSLAFSMTSCGGADQSEKEKEKMETEKEDLVSEDEFEKEMDKLDEDVKDMESDTTKTIKTTSIEKNIENGKKMVEEKTIVIKKEMKEVK